MYQILLMSCLETCCNLDGNIVNKLYVAQWNFLGKVESKLLNVLVDITTICTFGHLETQVCVSVNKVFVYSYDI